MNLVSTLVYRNNDKESNVKNKRRKKQDIGLDIYRQLEYKEKYLSNPYNSIEIHAIINKLI